MYYVGCLNIHYVIGYVMWMRENKRNYFYTYLATIYNGSELRNDCTSIHVIILSHVLHLLFIGMAMQTFYGGYYAKSK